MRETSITDDLNCKTQAMQGCVKKINSKKNNDAYWNNFVVTGVSLKDHIGRVDILKDDSL